jgi:hypothetical protein
MIWLAVLVLCGTAVIRSALAGTVVLALVPAYLPAGLIKYQPLLFGAAAIVAAIGYEAFAGWRMPVTNRAAKSPVRARLGARPRHGAPFPAVTP